MVDWADEDLEPFTNQLTPQALQNIDAWEVPKSPDLALFWVFVSGSYFPLRTQLAASKDVTGFIQKFFDEKSNDEVQKLFSDRQMADKFKKIVK